MILNKKNQYYWRGCFAFFVLIVVVSPIIVGAIVALTAPTEVTAATGILEYQARQSPPSSGEGWFAKIFGRLVSFTRAAIAKIIIAIANFILRMLALIIAMELGLIRIILNPVTWGGPFTQNPMVTTGWGIIRNLVNMGFVLAIVVIAIGFILRLQSYGSTKLLWRLIVAAILVNFSLIIAGLFLDAANIVTNFFLAPLGGFTGFGNLVGGGPALAGLIGVQLSPTDAQVAAQAGSWVAAALLTVLFVFIAIIVIGALAIMLLMRVFWLWILMIFAPAAWLMWIFPMFESNWHRWWRDFLRWTFFAPITVFFVYLAFVLINSTVIGSAVTQLSTTGNYAPSALNLPINVTAPDFIMRFFVFIGLLIGGLITANSLSITGAAAGLQMASSAATWPARYGKRVARETGVRVGGATAAKTGDLIQRGTRVPILGHALRYTGIGLAGRKLSGLGAGAEKEALDKAAKATEFQTNAALISAIDRGGIVGFAALEELQKRGAVGNLTPAQSAGLRRYVAIAQRHQRTRALLYANPAVAPALGIRGLTPQGVVQGMSAREIAGMHYSALDAATVPVIPTHIVRGLANAPAENLSQIWQHGAIAQRDAMRTTPAIWRRRRPIGAAPGAVTHFE